MLDFSRFNHTNWTNQYHSNDLAWLNESLNCDQINSSLLHDVSFLNYLSNAFFYNLRILLDSKSNVSDIDLLIVFLSKNSSTSDMNSSQFYSYFIKDILNTLNVFFLDLLVTLKTDINDVASPLFLYNPELTLGLHDHAVLCFSDNTLHTTVNSVFSSFISSLGSVPYVNDVITDIFMFTILIWVVSTLLISNSKVVWDDFLDSFKLRAFYYAYSMSREKRLQFEAVLTTAFLFVTYWAMVLISFDDDQEEVIELLDSSLFYFFSLIVFYLCYRYSINSFAFLDVSVKQGRTVGFISKQFFKDALNIFSLALRFYILLFRINVYDALDDFFDSYYIFIADFDDDEYLSETFISLYGNMFFTQDNNDGRSASLEDENGTFFDLFFIYSVTWGKLFYFIFFTFEEAGRLALAFYISYLIVFEVHSVNCSYKESNFNKTL